MVGTSRIAERLSQQLTQSEGWMVYYTAGEGRTLYGDVETRHVQRDRCPPLQRQKREAAEMAMVWARKLFREGKALMSQRKNAKGETEYLVCRR